jgi:hypothetical protein
MEITMIKAQACPRVVPARKSAMLNVRGSRPGTAGPDASDQAKARLLRQLRHVKPRCLPRSHNGPTDFGMLPDEATTHTFAMTPR